MIQGFEEQTEPLTDYEEGTLLPAMIRGLRTKIGADAAITNKEMVSKLKEKGYNISDARVRKVINYIRMRQLVPGLVASSSGYYISNDPAEIRKYIESLRGRENAMKLLIVSFERYLDQLVA